MASPNVEVDSPQSDGQEKFIEPGPWFQLRPVSDAELEEINQPVSKAPFPNPVRVSGRLRDAVLERINNCLTFPVPNLTKVEDTKIHNVGPDCFYMELNGHTPVNYLQGRPVEEGEQNPKQAAFKILVTNPLQSLPSLPAAEQQRLEKLLAPIAPTLPQKAAYVQRRVDGHLISDKVSIADLKSLPPNSADALRLLGVNNTTLKSSNESASVFPGLYRRGFDTAQADVSAGLSELGVEPDAQEELENIAKHKLKVYLPDIYQNENSGENSTLSSLVKGTVPPGSGMGLNTPIYALCIGPTVGPNIPDNPVAQKFNQIVSTSPDPVLIIEGHGGETPRGYVMGESFNNSETLSAILDRVRETKYSCVVLNGCNYDRSELDEYNTLGVPVFFVKGLHNTNYFSLIGDTTANAFDPADGTLIEYKNDPHRMLGLEFNEKKGIVERVKQD